MSASADTYRLPDFAHLSAAPGDLPGPACYRCSDRAAADGKRRIYHDADFGGYGDAACGRDPEPITAEQWAGSAWVRLMDSLGLQVRRDAFPPAYASVLIGRLLREAAPYADESTAQAVVDALLNHGQSSWTP